jgi:DNA-directed RNA polymerase specialized sigma subunit
VLANDRAALGKLAAAIAAQEGRAATEAERAEALGVGITELRKREEAVQGLMRLRHMDPILEPDDVQMASSTDRDVADEALDAILRSDLTRELLRAVDPGDGRADPLGLAAVYLGFWEGLGRSEIADELGVSPKTVSSAMARTLRDIDASRFA